MDKEATEVRLDRIETKLAYLEDFLLKLQEETLKRNALLDRLTANQDAVREKLQMLTSELEEIPSRRPPHY